MTDRDATLREARAIARLVADELFGWRDYAGGMLAIGDGNPDGPYLWRMASDLARHVAEVGRECAGRLVERHLSAALAERDRTIAELRANVAELEADRERQTQDDLADLYSGWSEDHYAAGWMDADFAYEEFARDYVAGKVDRIRRIRDDESMTKLLAAIDAAREEDADGR